MKKRKKPIFLAAVVVLLLISVMAFNASAFTAASQSPDLNAGLLTPEQQQEKDKKAQEQIKAQKAEAALKAKSGAKAGDDGDDIVPKGKGMTALDNDQPKILAPKAIPSKKISPQDAGVNSQAQWYSKESGAGGN
jgi:hypothetical protein